MKSNRVGLSVAGAVLALLLAGCGAGDKAAQPEVTSMSEEVQAQSAATAPVETEKQEPAQTSSENCIEGVWLADNDYFASQMGDVGGADYSVTGEVTLTFTSNGIISTHYDDWRLTVVIEGSEGVVIRDGVDSGTYSADGSVLSVSEEKVDSTAVVVIEDMEMPFEVEATEFVQAPYSCDAGSLTITTSDGTVVLSRVK